jgi:hypothetical protein
MTTGKRREDAEGTDGSGCKADAYRRDAEKNMRRGTEDGEIR